MLRRNLPKMLDLVLTRINSVFLVVVEDRLDRPDQLLYHSDTYAQHRCWLQNVSQSNSEAADSNGSDRGSDK